MFALVFCPLIVAIAAGVGFWRTARDERPLLAAGFAAHLVGVVAMVVYTEHIYGGDMLLYHSIGRELVRIVERDPRYLSDLVKLVFHLENDLTLEMFAGGSSATMCGLMALLMFPFGTSLYAICLAVSMFAFVGQCVMYRAVAPALDPVERRPVLASVMLVPSVVFWTSGFIKEAFAVGFLGFLCFGLTALSNRRLLRVVSLAVGAVGVAMIKPYVLLPTALAVGGWIYASRPRHALGLGYKVLGIALGIAGLFAVSRLFPEYSVDRLAENVSLHQRNYDLVKGGGSNLTLGPDSDDEAPSLVSQAKYFPLALVNALLRPFLFEARNLSMLLAGVEMTVVLVLVVVLARRGLKMVIRVVARRPPLMFSAVFVLSFCIAVGLATRNLGTLSRYRVPAMPMYVGLLVSLRARLNARAPVVVASPTRARAVSRRLTPAAHYLQQRRSSSLRKASNRSA